MIKKQISFGLLSVVLALFISFTSLYGMEDAPSLQVLLPMDQFYHPVSTTHFEAQKSFNKGLKYIFAFNHDVAYESFKEASEHDPNLAMAYWGMALALGQNINEDVTPENELRSYAYIQKALALSDHAWENEKAYIKALATRYTNDPKADFKPLRFRYRDAMKALVEAYPEDLDASTLYAESILDLDPWKYWTFDGKPRDGIYDAIDILESVMKRYPDHIGANHYYIHALEDSPFPERALMSAHRLETLMPESGHLLHMPNHIYILVGDYERALNSSKKAIEADRAYIKEKGENSGSYPTHYLPHNMWVLARVYMLMEDYHNAIKSAQELLDFIKPHFEAKPALANKSVVPLEIYLHFHKWKEILEYEAPSRSNYVQAYLHFARAMAFTALNDPTSAQKEKWLMMQSKNKMEQTEEIANNPASTIMEIAEHVLDGMMAKAQNNHSETIDQLKKAIDLQERLDYDEPPAWYFPIHAKLGIALMQEGNFKDAEGAFKKGLQNLQRNGRLLFGLYLSLKGQGRIMDAYWVEREAKTALRFSSVKLEEILPIPEKLEK
jgi:tetratricopeptide (TPR) repeat protein